MKVVIDTNVILMSLPKLSPYRPIFDGLINGEYKLVITEGIFQEYKEIIGQKTTKEIANNIGKLFEQLSNVEIVKVYFHWDLITKDPDDNKFVDCAIASNAKYIVTNDNHFKALQTLVFPKLEIINADGFLEEIQIEKG